LKEQGKPLDFSDVNENISLVKKAMNKVNLKNKYFGMTEIDMIQHLKEFS